MLAQVENTPQGYIVSIYYPDKNGICHWERLRNFGDRQGDAIEFRDWDLPHLEDHHIRLLIQKFDINVKYKRIGKNQYRRQ